MSDIGLCREHHCPSRKKCRRYMTEAKGLDWYMRPRVDGKQCEYFLPLKGKKK